MQPFVASINRLVKRLERAFTHQQRFVADAAHELRSPIAALSLQIQAIDGSALPAPQQQRFDEMRAGMKRVARLIDQLLSLARYESDQNAQARTTQFDDVLKEQVATVIPDAEVRGVDVGFRSVTPVAVWADASALGIVVRNLLENAMRHTPHDGRVDLSLTKVGSNAVLEIEDSGPGIPEDELARVLEPFFRGAAPVGEGSGLGLSIVQRILARVGGTIELANVVAPDHTGLRVTVTWPAAQP